MNRSVAGWLMAALVGTLRAVVAAEDGYGTLPAGATSVSEITDVAAEICRDHLVDPAALAGRLPQGYRLVTAAEYAHDDPALTAYLQANPRLASHGVGSLCFLSVGRFLVDGVPVQPGRRIPMAFWWVRAVGPRDGRMQGKVEWLQVASWYARDVTERALVVATDPTAEFTDLQVEETAAGVWRLRLALPGETISAEIRCSGASVKRRASGEQFMSVPMAGAGTGAFWVITYFGHHHRPAGGEWRSTGHGVFADSLALPKESELFGTFFQSDWSARSGLYRPAR